MRLKNIVYILFLILLMKGVFAIGISPGNVVINFEPNFSTTIEYSIVNTMPFEVGVEIGFGGPLSEYMNISQKYIESLKPSEVKKIILTVNLPEKIDEPGLKRHTLSAVEQRSVEGASGMVARGGVIDLIDIWVLYPEIYPKAELTASDASVNDTAAMRVTLWNYGKPNITFVKGYVEIMDLEGKVIDTITLSSVFNVPSFEAKEMEGSWKTLDVTPSIYSARAVLNADGKELVTDERKFKVGELKLKLLSYTQKFYKDQINEFELFVENSWNHDVEGVFAEVFVKMDGKVVAQSKTVNYQFLPWEKKPMKGFLNTAGLKEGIYDTEIVLSYLGRTTSEMRSIEVINKPIPTSLILIVSANVIIVSVIIIIVLVILIRKRRKKG